MDYEDRLQAYILAHQIPAQLLRFSTSTHSVAEAAAAAGVEPTDFIKSIGMITPDDRLVVAIVKGEDRVSTRRVGRALGCGKPRLATPDELLERTGYPCGGTPPFGFSAEFLIDERVLECARVYGGGGSDRALIRMNTADLKRISGAEVATLRSQ